MRVASRSARVAPRVPPPPLSAQQPAAGGGRVLSADNAPQTPQAPSEDVSAATRPSSVLARPGTSGRVAVRRRLLPSGRSSCAELVHQCSPPPYRATVVCLRVGEPTVRRRLLLGAPTGDRGRCASPQKGKAAASTRKEERPAPSAGPPVAWEAVVRRKAPSTLVPGETGSERPRGEPDRLGAVGLLTGVGSSETGVL